jgi:hypothetical protein
MEGFLGFLVVLLVCTLWFFIARDVYKDTTWRGYPAEIWAILVFLFGIFALLAYYAVGGRIGGKVDTIPAGGGRRMGGEWGSGNYSTGMTNPNPPVSADPAFFDEQLDRLIADSEFREARNYLNDMIKIAKEMNDQKALANYRKYEKKISDAASRSTIRKW